MGGSSEFGAVPLVRSARPDGPLGRHSPTGGREVRDSPGDSGACEGQCGPVAAPAAGDGCAVPHMAHFSDFGQFSYVHVCEAQRAGHASTATSAALPDTSGGPDSWRPRRFAACEYTKYEGLIHRSENGLYCREWKYL